MKLLFKSPYRTEQDEVCAALTSRFQKFVKKKGNAHIGAKQ